MAVSLNKLQNSQRNEKELIKKLTIRISNLNCGWRIRILDPKIWGNFGGFPDSDCHP